MAKNLFEFYKEKGLNLPSVNDRVALAKQYGIENYTGDATQNQALLTALQSQTPGIVTPNGVTVGGTPDITKLPDEFKNGAPQDTTVVSYMDNINGTTTNTTADGKTDNGSFVKNPDGTYNFVPNDTTPVPSFKDTLGDNITKTKDDIKKLEDEINGVSGGRNDELASVGIYDKMKLLNKLNDDLARSEAAKIAIPLEARSKLSGTATKSDYASYTSPQLEKAALKSLSSSLDVNRLTNEITTQLAITNQKFDEKKKVDEFNLERKDKYLSTLQSTYGDIITGEQATALEGRKQQNAIDLKNLEFTNGMLKDAYTDAIKKGANPADVMSAIQDGDISKLYGLAGNTTLTKDQITDTTNTIASVQGMLDNTAGLSASVGSTWFGRTAIFDGKWQFGDANKFQIDAKALVSAETIAYFLKVKAQGATFGAMSEAEWDILARASDAKYLGIDAETGKSVLKEDEFKKRLTVYQTTAKKALVFDALMRAGKNPDQYLKNVSADTINTLYKEYSSPEPTNYSDELSGGKVSANIPQKNNNPGNVKSGGLSSVEALATGKDSQGHLIFPTPEAGYRALALDLGAKVSGNSRYLPANPTLEQLGKVYAEDGTWGKSVASILGVPLNTPMRQVPLEKLIYAISKQEGYFA